MNNPQSASSAVTPKASVSKLKNTVKTDDKLSRLARMINWELLDEQYESRFDTTKAPAARLLFGLLYLQAKEDISCDNLRKQWKHSPEWQYFCGETEMSDELPIHPSLLSIWRRELGPVGYKLMCAALAGSLPNLSTKTLH